MKKCILLILMSGVLFGSKQLDSSIEKTLNNAGEYYVAAATTGRDHTKQLNETKKPALETAKKASNTSKKVENIINLDKNSYCFSPVGRHQFYGMNNKGEYRADIKFKYCVINKEKMENMIVGIIVTDLNALNGYVQKYSYLHFKEKEKLRKSVEGNNYYYDSSWAWSSSTEYPASIWEKK